MKRTGAVITQTSVEFDQEPGSYGLLWEEAQREAERHGGRLTGEHQAWTDRYITEDEDGIEMEVVIRRYQWRMVER